MNEPAFNPGEKVQWTRMRITGEDSRSFWRVASKYVGPSKKKPDHVIVRHRGKNIRLHKSRIRKLTDTSELNDLLNILSTP